MTKSLPKHYVFYCCCALKYHAAANFLIGSRESFENGRGFWRMWPRMIVRTLQHCLSHSYFTCKAGPVRRRQSRRCRVALQRIRRFFCSSRPPPPAPWLSPHPRGLPQTPQHTLPKRSIYLCTLFQGCGSGSGFNWVSGSGSGFGIRIRMGKNDPQK
jgi:hypothetical protein